MTKDLPEESVNTLPFRSLEGSRGPRRRVSVPSPDASVPRARRKRSEDDDEESESGSTAERGETRGGDLFQLYLHQMTEIRLLPREEELRDELLRPFPRSSPPSSSLTNFPDSSRGGVFRLRSSSI